MPDLPIAYVDLGSLVAVDPGLHYLGHAPVLRSDNSLATTLGFPATVNYGDRQQDLDDKIVAAVTTAWAVANTGVTNPPDLGAIYLLPEFRKL